jgi:hypothetical protein
MARPSAADQFAMGVAVRAITRMSHCKRMVNSALFVQFVLILYLCC